jgi:hypothetical protein
LLLKLAARDPAARPQSFAEVIQALEGRGQERAGAPGETAGAPGILGTARRRIAAGAAAAVLLLGMLSLFLLPGSPGEAPSGKEGGTIAGAGDGKERPEAVARPGDPTATPGGEEARPAVASGERTTVASPGPAAPPAPPDGERQARLRELEEVLKNWRADLLTAAEAEQAIEKLKGQSADAAMVAAAASALKEVESSRNAAVTREGEASERVLQKFVAEKVAPEVQAERFGEAVKILQELALKFPGSKAAIDLEIGKVVEAAGAALKAAQAEAAAFSGAGEFARAADRMREVEPRLPAVLREEAIKTITAATEAEARFKASEAEVRKAAEKVAAHLVALDFVAAAAAAAGIPETPAPPLAARGQWLAEEVDLFREAWEKLLSGVERSRGKELALAFHSPAPGDGDARAAATLRLKESSREGNAVLLTLQAGSAARSEKRDLLALDDAALAHFLEPAAPAPGGEGAASPAAALPPRSREGLGLVLLHLEGPARSAPHLLENTTLGEEKRKHYAARIAEVAGLHLPARLAEAKAQLEEAAAAAAAGPPAPEEAALIADRLQRLIAAHRGYPGYAKVRGELAAVALEALKQYLRPRGTDDLFHARSVRRSETKLELVYDFNTEAELEDFTPVGPGSARVLERKALKLRGEFRLVRGDPFRNWLSVKAEVSRYNPAQPNINVALWTQENDQVTYDRARLLRSPNRPPAPDTAAGEDYLVFAVGYQPQGAESLVLSAIGSGLIAPTPCFAVLGGARGKMLHGDGTYKSLWSESTLNKVQGPQMIQLLLKPDAFDWYVNRTRLSTRAYEKEPSLLKSLFRSGATGSVSLFTNGEWIHFESLKVEGEPNPGWVEAELERRAVQELKKIEPDYPFRK